MLKNFQNDLDKYLKVANQIDEISVSLENDALSKRFKLHLDRMEKLEFHIVVIGQFKRGKSTLINYFLGDELLPTGVVPITSIITRIKYGKVPKAKVLFQNGQNKPLAIDLVEEYVSEQKNPKNLKKVDSIEIFYPSEVLKYGMVLIDTPGIGSGYIHNTEVAYDYISEADAAIFVTSSDAPMGEVELVFLEEVKRHIEKIFFIQNKVDYLLTEKEKNQSLTFTAETIDRIMDSYPRIYPISARLAYEGRREGNINKINHSGIKDFEEDLEKFLLKDKGEVLINSYREKIISILKGYKEYAKFQVNILNSPIETLEQQLNQFHKKFKDIARLKREAIAIIEADLENMIMEFSEALYKFRVKKVPEIKNRLTNVAEEGKNLSSKDLNSNLNKCLEAEIECAYNSWNEQQEIKIRKAYEKTIFRFTSKLNDTIDFINDITYAMFQINLAQPIEDFELINRDSFYFKFGSSSPALLTPNIKDFIFLLPRSIRNKKLLTEVLNRVDQEVEKNGNNLKWDYMCKINDSKLIFESTFQEKIEYIQKSVEDVMLETMEFKKQEGNRIKNDINKFVGIEKKLELIESQINYTKAD